MNKCMTDLNNDLVMFFLRSEYGISRHGLQPVGLRAGRQLAHQAHADQLQAPPAADHEVLLRYQPQSRRQRPQAAITEDGTPQARATGEQQNNTHSYKSTYVYMRCFVKFVQFCSDFFSMCNVFNCLRACCIGKILKSHCKTLYEATNSLHSFSVNFSNIPSLRLFCNFDHYQV